MSAESTIPEDVTGDAETLLLALAELSELAQ